MWNACAVAESLHEAGAYGFSVPATPPVLDWPGLKIKRDAYISRLNGIYAANLGKDGITVLHGHASFLGPSTVLVGDQEYTAPHVLITCGSRAWIPSIPGAREHGNFTDSNPFDFWLDFDMQ